MLVVGVALAAAAWQPTALGRFPTSTAAALPAATAAVRLPTNFASPATPHARCAAPVAKLPQALALVLLVPYVLAFTSEDFRKSDLVQKGAKQRRMKVEPPKLRGVRLIPEVEAVTRSFRKQYDKKARGEESAPQRDGSSAWKAITEHARTHCPASRSRKPLQTKPTQARIDS